MWSIFSMRVSEPKHKTGERLASMRWANDSLSSTGQADRPLDNMVAGHFRGGAHPICADERFCAVK